MTHTHTQQTYAIQERAVSADTKSGPGGKGWRDDGVAYTLEARQQVQAIAFVQKTRDEVRLMGGDGQIVGALSAQPGMKQQCYIAEPRSVALRGRDGGATAELGDEVMGTLRASGGGGDKPHVLAFSCKDYGADATDNLAPTMRAMGHSGSHANAGGQLAVCVTGDITHTLKAEGFDASEDGTGRGQPIVTVRSDGTQPIYYQHDYAHGRIYGTDGVSPAVTCGNESGAKNILHDMAVRRLMPVECERLMGFPDGYTLIPVGKKLAADGPRYKQLGNSWAVPVVRWIGERIDAQVKQLEPKTVEHDPLILWLLAP